MNRVAVWVLACVAVACGGRSGAKQHPESAGEASIGGAGQASDQSGLGGDGTAGASAIAGGPAGGASAAGAAGKANVCTDYVAPPDDARSCRIDGECKLGVEYCVPPGETPEQCGVCHDAERTCATAADCHPGYVCAEYSVLCPCPDDPISMRCQPACSATSCAADERCNEGSGVCAPRSCLDDYVCPDEFFCNTNTSTADTDAHGCAPVRCEEGFACPPNARCTPDEPGHGCATMACRSDATCDCGACVNSRCASGAGTCQPVPI